MPRSSLSDKIAADLKRFDELKAALAQIAYFSKGTVLARMVIDKCGRAHCPCGSNPQKRHGPYFEWTYKKNGKTVNVRLTPQAAPIFHNAARQYRILKSNLARLEKLSRRAITRLEKQVDSNLRG
jgi:hypothetical protein